MKISWSAVDLFSRIYRESDIDREAVLIRFMLAELDFGFDESEDNEFDALELIEDIIREESTLVYGDSCMEVYRTDDGARFVFRIDDGEKVGVACWKEL